MKYKLNTFNPCEVVDFINNNTSVKFCGLCYYSTEEKVLKSRSPDEILFYFDPNHCVLEIKIL